MILLINSSLFKNVITIILATLIPGLELRASIPIGISLGVNPLTVFLIAVIVNAILGPVILFLLDTIILDFFLKFDRIKKFYDFSVKRTQRKAKPLIEKYGLIGLALFIAVPLPGSGSYTGALAAFLLGIKPKKFFLANFLGVLIAGLIMLSISMKLI